MRWSAYEGSMRTFKKIALALLVLIVLIALCSGVTARVRESKITKVRLGMHKRDVERLPACEHCPTGFSQYVYRANQSLWYGRLEDALVVCYTNDVVCDTSRVGL